MDVGNLLSNLITKLNLRLCSICPSICKVGREQSLNLELMIKGGPSYTVVMNLPQMVFDVENVKMGPGWSQREEKTANARYGCGRVNA